MWWKLFNAPLNEFLAGFWSWSIIYFSKSRIPSALKTSLSSKSVGLVQIYSRWGKFCCLNVKTFTWMDEEEGEGHYCGSRHDRAGLQPDEQDVWLVQKEVHLVSMNPEKMSKNKLFSFLPLSKKILFSFSLLIYLTWDWKTACWRWWREHHKWK